MPKTCKHRDKILAVLATPEGQAMTLTEIAAKVGCSIATAGKYRVKHYGKRPRIKGRISQHKTQADVTEAMFPAEEGDYSRAPCKGGSYQIATPSRIERQARLIRQRNNEESRDVFGEQAEEIESNLDYIDHD